MNEINSLIESLAGHSDNILTWIGAVITVTTVLAPILSVVGNALQKAALETETEIDDRVASFLVQASAAIGVFLTNISAALPVIARKGR